jgi:hypothetical protein
MFMHSLDDEPFSVETTVSVAMWGMVVEVV